MNSQTLGIVIGGLIPAVCFGISGIFAKTSTSAGISPSFYLIVGGLSIAFVGFIALAVFPERSVSPVSAFHAALMGITWAVGAGLVAIALIHFHIPIGKLAPLYNMNTLVAVLIALWVFAEWQQVKVPQLLLGSILVVIGGTLVAKA